ncbi:hypothetical protein ONS95_006515 [Cadophora gregata]|uniref:uncharacterized protein n=1 Tax=Cadophora gregata TaxID=51156 RepID=UPI0026DB6745|nr:uncharacterized protein ONS95_006515 [Cadophora gregata]KAK0101338.1 hypothetical protein ONS95_006515 [Cadophora gregata]KAK0106651.1 hypothetical protein ONS96_004270 [Cadophora gregata f. sp. sojae]
MGASVYGSKRMDNSGDRSLQVPGFGDIPVEFELRCEDRFAHGIRDWQQVPAVTARELAMVAVMNAVTDKPAWHVNIFNEKIVGDWREEAFATTPLMSEKAWNWCMDELRDKAILFGENQYVRVLDTGSCICKSDTLLHESLGAEFRSGIAPLLERPDKDWQPKSDRQVLNIVDPSLFPLVYGRSLVLADGGQVNLENVLGSYEHATVAPEHLDRRVDSANVQKQMEEGATEILRLGVDEYDSECAHYFWSSNYQYLPSDVEFSKDVGTEIRITSYINNLHLHIQCYINKDWGYGWDHANQGQRGPIPLRILTYGVEWENEYPKWALSFNVPAPARVERYLEAQEMLRNTTEVKTAEGKKKRLAAERLIGGYGDVREGLNMGKPSPELWNMAKEYLERPENGSSDKVKLPEDWAEDELTTWYQLLRKHERLLFFKHPEPGTAFSYQDWKTGNSNEAIVSMVTEGSPFVDNLRPVVPDHKPYVINLQDTFRKEGLQVIVKIDGIELTPENPRYPGSNWKLEGQMNEHIVATAMYSYDVQNVTHTCISFRQETPIWEHFYRYATHRFAKEKWEPWTKPAERYHKGGKEIAAIAEILGFREEDLCKETIPAHEIQPFQNIGSIVLS